MWCRTSRRPVDPPCTSCSPIIESGVFSFAGLACYLFVVSHVPSCGPSQIPVVGLSFPSHSSFARPVSLGTVLRRRQSCPVVGLVTGLVAPFFSSDIMALLLVESRVSSRLLLVIGHETRTDLFFNSRGDPFLCLFVFVWSCFCPSVFRCLHACGPVHASVCACVSLCLCLCLLCVCVCVCVGVVELRTFFVEVYAFFWRGSIFKRLSWLSRALAKA